MKVGIFGGGILLILTLVFSFIAIQNNKIAREITVKSFDLDKPKEETQKLNKGKEEDNSSSIVEAKSQKVKAESKWDKLDKKFENFDKKFENF